MAPLLAFIATIKIWFAILIGALALAFGSVAYLTNPGAHPPATRALVSLYAAVLVAFMLFLAAFLIFTLTTDRFSPLSLFPSIFVALTAFSALTFVGLRLEDPYFSFPVFAVLALIASFVTTIILCAVMILKLNFAW